MVKNDKIQSCAHCGYLVLEGQSSCVICSKPVIRKSTAGSNSLPDKQKTISQEKNLSNESLNSPEILTSNHAKPCPCCSKEMTLKSLNIESCDPHLPDESKEPGQTLEVDNCSSCNGLFLDKGELESFLKWAFNNPKILDCNNISALLAKPAVTIDNALNKNCPVCKKVMRKKHYAKGSDVLVDFCKKHGVWLEVGKLSQIVKWSQERRKLKEKLFLKNKKESKDSISKINRRSSRQLNEKDRKSSPYKRKEEGILEVFEDLLEDLFDIDLLEDVFEWFDD